VIIHFHRFALNLVYKMEAKEILKMHVAKLASLTAEQFDYFFSFFKKQSFKKGQTLISEGDMVDCEYFVISGCLKSFFCSLQCQRGGLPITMPYIIIQGPRSALTVLLIRKYFVLAMLTGKNYVTSFTMLNIFSGGEPIKVISQRINDCCRL